jgi:predicted RNA binding protein YcfA (HicA-like mRNA interferase family)
MSKQRLFSSTEIINALLRGGFELARRSKSSHQALKRRRPEGGHDVTIVPIGESEIPKGTLDSILKLGNVDYDEFLTWAKIKRKERKPER